MPDLNIQTSLKIAPKVIFEHVSYDLGEEKLLQKQAIGNISLPLVLEDQYVGIEIEVENVRGSMKTPAIYWGTDIDNSLRNNGLEFKSIAMKGKRIIYALEEFMNKLKECNFHFSPRTSIHIHFNVLDWTLEVVKRLFIIYLVFEKLLYKFVGKDRETNIFCLPVLSSESLENIVASISSSSIKNWGSKYFGINISAILTFGTVEVRHLGGTENLDTIVNWLNLWFKMIQAAKRMSTKELLTTIVNLNTSSNYYGFASAIFGEYLHLLDVKGLSKSMEEGVVCVKYGNISFDFSKKLKGEVSLSSPAFKCMSRMKLLIPNVDNGEINAQLHGVDIAIDPPVPAWNAGPFEQGFAQGQALAARNPFGRHNRIRPG